jgi:membrane-bound serine protease (ClpP class)
MRIYPIIYRHSPREAKMEFLINPNVAYVLIVLAVLLGLIAIIIPGTGLAEVGLAFCLVLAGYTIYKLGINVWAVVVLLLSIVPFLFALRTKTWRLPLLAATILLLVGGSLFMFTDKNGWPAVDPLLAVIVSVLSGGLIWIGTDRSIDAMKREPVHNPDELIGQIGEARTAIQAEGSVYIAGELWSARSEKPIKAGSAVRILQREGFVLTVEKES